MEWRGGDEKPHHLSMASSVLYHCRNYNSAGDVSLYELSGDGAAAKLLWELGVRGMTVRELVHILESLKWEQELRLLKAPGNYLRIVCVMCNFQVQCSI